MLTFSLLVYCLYNIMHTYAQNTYIYKRTSECTVIDYADDKDIIPFYGSSPLCLVFSRLVSPFDPLTDDTLSTLLFLPQLFSEQYLKK